MLETLLQWAAITSRKCYPLTCRFYYCNVRLPWRTVLWLALSLAMCQTSLPQPVAEAPLIPLLLPDYGPDEPIMMENKLLKEKPNILLIIADDANRQISPLDVPPYSQPTPNLDKLAKQGVLFKNAQACSVDGKSSRTCLVTGNTPPMTGVYNNNLDISSNQPGMIVSTYQTLFQYLSDANYITRNYGKVVQGSKFANQADLTARLSDRGPFAQPIQFSEPEKNNTLFGSVDGSLEDTRDARNVKLAIGEIAIDQFLDQPAFYGIGLEVCHTPLHIPVEFLKLVPEDVPQPPRPSNDLDDIPDRGIVQDQIGRVNGQEILDRGDGLRFVRHYFACLSIIDELVGRLLQATQKTSKPWVIIYTSDNGAHMLDKARIGKTTLWPAATDVPMIISGQQFQGGRSVSTPVSLADIFPTIVGLVGQKPQNALAGIDLATMLDNEASREEVVIYYQDTDGFRKAVVTEEWHFIEYFDESFELYERLKDPWALLNVAGQNSQVIEDLRVKNMF